MLHYYNNLSVKSDKWQFCILVESSFVSFFAGTGTMLMVKCSVLLTEVSITLFLLLKDNK